MPNSVYMTILQTQANQVGALGVTYQNASVPVVVRKLPKKEETLDTVPVFVVAPSERPESIEPFGSEDQVLVKYLTECVFIGPGDGDFTSNLDTWLTYREQVRRLFQFGIPGIQLPNQANLFFAEILPEAPLDRASLNVSYDYSGLAFRFWVQEMRQNLEVQTP